MRMNIVDYVLPGTQFIVSIKAGDIFEQTGLKIIHCPRTFETSSDVVPVDSVFGQFLKRFGRLEVDAQIKSWINRFENRGKIDENRKDRALVFDIGELCPVLLKNDLFCVAAFSNTYSTLCADNLNLSEYMAYWDNLWKNLSTISVMRDAVNVAVPGDRLVNIAANGFLLPQKISIIVNSFLHSTKFSGVCKHITICLYGREAETFDYEGWKNTLLPFLGQLSYLPIEWKVSYKRSIMEGAIPKENEEIGNVDVSSLFISDLREMISNLRSKEGEEYAQYEGSQKQIIMIDPQIEALYEFVQWFEFQDNLKSFFIRKRGNHYDKNGMFQLIGVLQDCSTFYGHLNRRSVIKLSLAYGGTLSERWYYLGNDIDNIINYVGQKLSALKKNHIQIYNSIRRNLPVEYRRD